MRLGRKFGRSDEIRTLNRKSRAVLKDAATATVERLEHRQMLSASALVTFNNGATDLTANFNGGNNSLTAAPAASTWSGTTGVLDVGGAAGGAVTSNADISQIFNQASTSLGDGLVHTVSAYVKSTDSSTANKPLQIGWVNSDTGGAAFNTSNSDGFMSARILGFNEVQTQVEVLGNSAVTSGGASTFTGAVLSDWLKLTFTAQETNTTTGAFAVSFSITDYGPSGTAAGTVLLAPVTSTVTVASFGTAATNGSTTGWAGWRDSEGGITVDNFSIDPPVVAPNPPVLAQPAVGNEVVLNWGAVNGATSYTVLRGLSMGSETPLAGGVTAASTFTDTTITDGTTYFYEVEATNTIGSSAPSNEVSVTPALTTAPLQVTGLGAVGASGQVTLTWNASQSGATSYIINRATYNPVTHVTGAYTAFPTQPTTNSYVDTTVTNGQQYSYTVTATNTIGNAPPSAAVIVLPAAPVTTLITFDTAAQETSNFIVDHDGTILQPGIQNNTTVLANNEDFGWNATAGIEDQANGSAVGGGLLTDPTNADENLNFTGSSFNLAAGGGATGLGATLGGATVSFMFEETGLPGTTRLGQVGFINILNSSFNSDNNGGAPVVSTTPAGTSFFGIRPYGTGELQLQSDQLQGGTVNTTVATVAPLVQAEWYQLGFTMAETAPGSNLYNYSVVMKDFGQSGTLFNATSGANTIINSTTPYSLTGFNATNGSGPDVAWAGVRQSSDSPNYDNFQVTGTPATAGPPAPHVTAVGNNNVVQLNWNQSAGADTYSIFRSSGPGGSGQETLLQGSVSGLSFTDTTAVNGTQYFYEVEPVHGGVLPGNFSNEVTVTPSPSVPGQVTGVNLTQVVGSVTINWSPVTFASSYIIQRATVVGGVTGAYSQIGTTTSATTFTDNSITDPSSPPTSPNVYSYEVIAVDTTGNGTPSTAVQANYFNGAEQFVYNNQWWNSTNQSTTGYQMPGLNPGASQITNTVNFVASANVPAPGFPTTDFSQILTGKIIVTDTDLGLTAGDSTDARAVSFGMINDDDAYVMVAGHLVASDVGSDTVLTFLGASSTSSPVTGSITSLNLTTGSYDFAMFGAQIGGNWTDQLEWSTPHTQGANPAGTNPNTFVVIPNASLLVATGAPAAPVLTTPIFGNPGSVFVQWTNSADNELEEFVQRSTTANFAPGTFQTLATLPADDADGTSPGSTTSETFIDQTNSQVVNTWYRVVSANLDGQTASNIGILPQGTGVVAGIDVHGYDNQYWRSTTQAGNAQVTAGVNLSTFDAQGTVSSIDNSGTNSSGPSIGLTGTLLTGTDFSEAFTGRLQITTPGTYTFSTNTQGQGFLYINGALVTSSNNNTGTGTANFAAAGLYDIAYLYSDGTGATWSYDLQYSGADTGNSLTDVSNIDEGMDSPPLVTNFQATSPDSSHVNLTWTASQGGILDYIIQRSTDPTFATGVTTFTSGITSNSFTDTTVAPGTTYYYQIQGADYDSNGSFAALSVPASHSITTSTTLATPTNVSSHQGALDNEVLWNYNLATTGLGSFTILRSTNSGAFAPIATNVSIASTVYLDQTLPITTPGTTYSYKVQAVATGLETSSAQSTQSPTETLIGITGTTTTPLTSAVVAPSPLTTNGGASIGASGIELTDGGLNEARSVFGTSGFPVESAFSTSFNYQATMPDATTPDSGDGFSFVLQAATGGPNAVGGSGGGLGYTGIGNSLAISFNMFNNVTQTGIAINGGAPALVDISTFATNSTTFGNAFHVLSATNQTDIFHITLAYSTNTNALVETIVDTGSPNPGGTGADTYTVTFPMSAHGGSPAALVGNSGAYAYAGFTGSTGGVESSTQIISNWNFGATQLAANGPNLTSVTFGDGVDAQTTQRSEVRRVVFNFDSAVANFPLSALTLTDRNTGGSGTSAPAAYAATTPAGGAVTLTGDTLVSSNSGKTWTLSFVSGSSTHVDTTGSLDDGIYDMAIDASQITNASLAPLASGNTTITFHRLYGDLTGTKNVTNGDLNSMKKAFGPLGGTFNAALDSDNNGVINNADLNNFKKRFLEVFTY